MPGMVGMCAMTGMLAAVVIGVHSLRCARFHGRCVLPSMLMMVVLVMFVPALTRLKLRQWLMLMLIAFLKLIRVFMRRMVFHNNPPNRPPVIGAKSTLPLSLF